MLKESRIYIAGHTGLLGTALLKRVGKEGFRNIIVRTHSEVDLTDSRAVDGLFRDERPEYVFLAAGLTGGIVANSAHPARFMHENISIQDNVFESANRYGVRRLVFYGSSCVYPKCAEQPIREGALLTGAIEETSAPYAVAKIAGLAACAAYNREYGTGRFIALVPNSMYGPADNFDAENSHVLSALMRKLHNAMVLGAGWVTLWGSGAPRREFVFSEDVADASVFAMKNAERLKNSHYNVGTGEDFSIKELASAVARVVGFEGLIKWDFTMPDGTARKLLDSSGFKALGWKSKTFLNEGLEKTYEWFLKNLAERAL